MASKTQSRRSGDTEPLRAVLALILLLTSMPAVVGVTFANSGPALTADICHPLQTLDRNSGQSVVPLLPVRGPAQDALADRGGVVDEVAASPTPLLEEPDPPPPKAAA